MPEPANSRADSAYLALEAMVVTLALGPGDAVTERHLIALSGYGRTPVREAIQRLSWEGLIDIRPRAGLRIAEIRAEDYRKVMATRRRLEPLLARLAAAHADSRQRRHLADCAAEMMASAEAGNVHGFLAADKAFDTTLLQACQNPFLVKAIAPLQTHARRFWMRFGSDAGPARPAALHEAAMRAIVAQDTSAAEAAMFALLDDLQRIARAASDDGRSDPCEPH